MRKTSKYKITKLSKKEKSELMCVRVVGLYKKVKEENPNVPVTMLWEKVGELLGVVPNTVKNHLIKAGLYTPSYRKVNHKKEKVYECNSNW